jgi:K+-sensing histidine kinase KdpD
MQQTVGDKIIRRQKQIESDDLLLGEVVKSLLDNAVKYSPEGGVIRIAAVKQDGRILLSVADNGSGIAEDKLKQLFEPFSRAEAAAEDFNHQGIGLNLYADKLIMQYLGGDIELAGNQPQGIVAKVWV